MFLARVKKEILLMPCSVSGAVLLSLPIADLSPLPVPAVSLGLARWQQAHKAPSNVVWFRPSSAAFSQNLGRLTSIATRTLRCKHTQRQLSRTGVLAQNHRE